MGGVLAEKRKVLVLGDTGFTGQHLMGHCRDDAEITCEAASAGGRTDLTDRTAVARLIDRVQPDVVVNLAAISSPGEADYRRIYEVNAFAVQNLLDALTDAGFEGRLITASSANIYGNRTTAVIRETDAPDPVNHYACSKVLAERFCAMAGGRFRTVLVRSFSCIGVGQKPGFLLPKIVRHFRERAPAIELGNIDVRRDFVDIRDAVRVYRRLMTVENPPDVLHIARNRAWSISEIIDLLTTISGHRLEVRVNPAFIRPNDLLFQQGDDTRMRGLGVVCRHEMEDTLRWMYESSDSRM